MRIIRIANSNITNLLSLPKDKFSFYREEVKSWLNKQYPTFNDVALLTKQHGGESMLEHVFNFLLNVDTDGMSPSQILNTRISIIHHDIDRLNKQKDNSKRSFQAVQSWKDHLSPDLKINNRQNMDIEFLIKNHDILGYFVRTFKSGLINGKSPKEILSMWIKKHPDVNTKHLLNLVLKMNMADNDSAGGISEKVKESRRKNLNSLFHYLSEAMK